MSPLPNDMLPLFGLICLSWPIESGSQVWWLDWKLGFTTAIIVLVCSNCAKLIVIYNSKVAVCGDKHPTTGKSLMIMFWGPATAPFLMKYITEAAISADYLNNVCDLATPYPEHRYHVFVSEGSIQRSICRSPLLRDVSPTGATLERWRVLVCSTHSPVFTSSQLEMSPHLYKQQ